MLFDEFGEVVEPGCDGEGEEEEAEEEAGVALYSHNTLISDLDYIVLSGLGGGNGRTRSGRIHIAIVGALRVWLCRPWTLMSTRKTRTTTFELRVFCLRLSALRQMEQLRV